MWVCRETLSEQPYCWSCVASTFAYLIKFSFRKSLFDLEHQITTTRRRYLFYCCLRWTRLTLRSICISQEFRTPSWNCVELMRHDTILHDLRIVYSIKTIRTRMQLSAFEPLSFSLEITCDTAVPDCSVVFCREGNHFSIRSSFVTSHC